ncbi:MAG: hypothetical protein ABT20_16320 [Rubrivivax sp. SCN 70-15]|nr:MAG: hypothetical protein ABT20_16320 [Rubrivivax sp. SCN 70-15]
MSATSRNAQPTELPWWRYGMVWLVIAGPVSAVIAGLTTVWIAERNADVEIIDPPAVSTAGTAAPKAAGVAAPTAAVGR